MAEIDKIIAKQPAPAPGARAPAALPAPQRAAGTVVTSSRRETLTTWVQVLLGVGVAAAVGFAWPYAHGCGLGLYGYLAAAAGVMLVGLWGVAGSWRRRIGSAHVVALLVTLAGAAMVGKTVLDRTNYPKLPATWRCGP